MQSLGKKPSSKVAAQSKAVADALFSAARSGDSTARRQLMNQFIPLVKKMAKQRKTRMRWADRQDLFQAGMVGLGLAIERLAATTPELFASYAGSWIRGEMSALVAQQTSVVRGKPKEKAKEPSELVPMNGKSEAESLRLAAQEEGAGPHEGQDGVVQEKSFKSNGKGDLSLEQAPARALADFRDPETLLIAYEEHLALICWVRESVQRLKPAERQLITARWLREPTQSLSALAQAHGVSIARMSQRHREALEHLREKLNRRFVVRSLRPRSERRRV